MTKVTKQIAKESRNNSKKSRVPNKHFLLEPFNFVWPQLDKGAASFILSQFVKYILSVSEKSETNKSNKSIKFVQSFLKKQLVFGVQQVTKELERGNLSLVFVCKSASDIVTRHLIALSALKQVPSAGIHDLSVKLAPLLGFKSLITFAVRKEATDEGIVRVSESVKDKLKPINYPWQTQEYVTARVKVTQAAEK